jgi:hypothetical protein
LIAAIAAVALVLAALAWSIFSTGQTAIRSESAERVARSGGPR